MKIELTPPPVRTLALAILGALIACRSLSAAEPVTLLSLLGEMTDRERLTRLPEPAYTTRLFSSYDRASVAPDKPGWFANADANQFIRTEDKGGRSEHVMLDVEGPGAIVRFWVTVAGTDGSGILRIYLDNADTPTVEGKVLELLSGGKLCGAPLSTSVAPATGYLQRGHNLYLPIPYARHCTITYESQTVVEKKGAFYYNVEARTYGKDVVVETFTLDLLRRNTEAIAATNRKLTGDDPGDTQPAVADLTVQTLAGPLAPGEALTRTIKGPRAIRCLAFSLGGGTNFNQALRSTVLELSFDGERTVWAPLGEFFGTGYRISPYKTWFTSVAADGLMQANWVMPFRQTCTVAIRNLGVTPVTIVKGELAVAPYRWDDSSMHFGAGWHELRKYPVSTKDKDANYVILAGQGVLIGTGVTVFNTVDSWWGEGDEKVYVDGEAFPSFFGTGSEDYYGYAWCNGNRFDHPFLAQPEGKGATSQGLAINSRYRALDAIPFNRGVRFDMEICHHSNSALINYAPATFWYMKPGGTATLGRDPIPLGDGRVQAMAKEKIVTERNDLMAQEPVTRGRIEGEMLTGSATAGRLVINKGWGTRWSGGEEFLWADGKPDAVARLTFKMKDAGPAEIILGLDFQPQRAKVQIVVNDTVVIKEMDTFAELNTRAQVDLYGLSLRQGENTITVKILGKNDKSQGYGFGIDYIEIWK